MSHDSEVRDAAHPDATGCTPGDVYFDPREKTHLFIISATDTMVHADYVATTGERGMPYATPRVMFDALVAAGFLVCVRKGTDPVVRVPSLQHEGPISVPCDDCGATFVYHNRGMYMRSHHVVACTECGRWMSLAVVGRQKFRSLDDRDSAWLKRR